MVDLIVDAHGRNKTALDLVAERADLLALTGDGIEAAVGVAVAAGLVHAASFAGLLASGGGRQPFAGGDGSASTFGSEASALGVAELS